MPTLVIHAPFYQHVNNRRTFDDVLTDGIATGYAISAAERQFIAPGCQVVVLQNDRNPRRAEGVLEEIRQSGMAGNGIIRYDLRISNLVECEFRCERLNRRGVCIFQ
jgi:hypothetical protein